MDRNKLKKLLILVIGLIIIVIIFAVFVSPSAGNGNLSESGQNSNSTFQASQYNSKKLVQDYLNPTEDEKRYVNSIYGASNNYFDEEGLHIQKNYDLGGEILKTDVWPNRESVKNIVKPDMEIFEIELTAKYLKITVSDVSERDLKRYVKEIDGEYKNEREDANAATIYNAYSDDYKTVDIKFDENKKQGTIQYYF